MFEADVGLSSTFSCPDFLIATLAATAEPSPNNAQIAIVVDEAGSPTRQAILPAAGDDVFESTSTGTRNNTPVNPVAERILSNLRAPANNYQGLAPRPDRVNQVPTAANAQGIFPPDALIFVAK